MELVKDFGVKDNKYIYTKINEHLVNTFCSRS